MTQFSIEPDFLFGLPQVQLEQTQFAPAGMMLPSWVTGVVGFFGFGLGAFIGWQACNAIASSEAYQRWAKEVAFELLPVNQIRRLMGTMPAGEGGTAAEITLKHLGIEIPKLPSLNPMDYIENLLPS